MFVENVQGMIDRGDFDHRYYEYTGFLFYILYPVLRAAPAAALEGAGAYLISRALVAALGTIAVLLIHRLGRELGGESLGLAAAALLAACPVAVTNAHMLRPDVALQAFFLLALLAFRRVGTLKGDLRAGAALGLAGAIKFSAVFLVPTFLAAWLRAPDHRVKGLLVAAGAAGAAFAVVSPYAFLHLPAFLEGMETQVSYHYDESPQRSVSYGGMVLAYLYIWWTALGTPATMLSAVGLWAALRERRTWLPLLLLPVTAVAILSTSEVRHDRFLLPTLVVPILLAARGLAELKPRLRGPAALFAVAFPLLDSVSYVREVSRPGTRDRAADWMAASLPAGSRILTRLEIGTPAGRFEYFRVPRLDRPPQMAETDYVVATQRDAPAPVAALTPRQRIEPGGRYEGPTILVLQVPDARRPPYRHLALGGARLDASANQDRLPLLVDGRADTWWQTQGPQAPGDFLSVRLDEPALLARVETVLLEPKFQARQVQLHVLDEQGRWVPAPWIPGRAAPEDQVADGRGFSQVYLLDPPRRTTGIRLLQTRNIARRWAVSELLVAALGVRGDEEPGPSPAPQSPRHSRAGREAARSRVNQ